MPHRLKQRQAKIQDKRKTTPWSEFVMEICSWSPMMYYRQNGIITIYPNKERIGSIVSLTQYMKYSDQLLLEQIEGKSFFKKLSNLNKHVSIPAVRQYYENSNSTYSDSIADSKNCYLSRCSIGVENVGYSLVVKRTQNVYNSVKVQKGEGNTYMSSSIDNSFNVFYSKCIDNCANIRFSFDLNGCKECLFCHGLENQTYCIKNIVYKKEEYFEIKNTYLSQKNRFSSRFQTLSGMSFSNFMCHDILNIYGATCVSRGRNGCIIGNLRGVKNMYDVILSGSDDDFYGVVDSGGHCSQMYSCIAVANSSSIYYSIYVESCSYCLGCIGLKNKSYCIFNKQYTKEDRYDKVDEIFTQMEQDGNLGKFFPGSMNPFYFNDTAAYLIDDSFTKEEVEAAGYMWRDEQIKVDIPEGVDVISVDDLDQYEGWMVDGQFISTTDRQDRRDNVRGMSRHINPSILKKVIKDHQGNVYRIVKMEYDFLIKHALPLPRKHWLERIKEHFKIEKRNETGDTRL